MKEPKTKVGSRRARQAQHGASRLTYGHHDERVDSLNKPLDRWFSALRSARVPCGGACPEKFRTDGGEPRHWHTRFKLSHRFKSSFFSRCFPTYEMLSCDDTPSDAQ